MIDWSKYPNFTEKEFVCRETGEVNMAPELLDRLQALRTEYGKPIVITSGYRSKNHSVERKKLAPGYHTKGMAVDIACSAIEAFRIVELAYKHGFRGIGISQRSGLGRFVHLDIRETPIIYSY